MPTDVPIANLPPVEPLLRAARNGDPEALGTVLESFRLILSRRLVQEFPEDLRSKAGTSDLIQETFLEAHRDFHQFQGTTSGELLAWLARLLQNNLSNFLRAYRARVKRRASREVRLPADGRSLRYDEGLVAKSPDPCNGILSEESRDAVRKAVGHLPESYREVLRLRYVERLSFQQIGDRLGQSPEAVRKVCVRALDRLGKELPP